MASCLESGSGGKRICNSHRPLNYFIPLLRPLKSCYGSSCNFIFTGATMNPSQNALYRIHQMQSEHLGEIALPYDEFNARLLKASKSDLPGLPQPPIDAKLKIQITINTRFQLGSLTVVQNGAEAYRRMKWSTVSSKP